MLGSTIVAGMLALVVATGGASAPGGPPDVPQTSAVTTTTAVPTITAVTVAPAPQGARRVSVTVAAAAGAPGDTPTGTVTVLGDGVPVAVLPLDGGMASFTTSALDPAVAHRLTARFAPTSTHAGSSCDPVEVAGPASAGGSVGNVTLTIPAGLLSITSDAEQVVDLSERGRTRRGPATARARVVVTDTRAGNLGFTVSATLVTAPVGRHGARAHAVALVGVRAEQVPGNALAATDVVTAAGRPPRAGEPATAVATYPSGLGTGSVLVTGVVVGHGLPRDVETVRVLWTVM